jgi:hypothetical protein
MSALLWGQPAVRVRQGSGKDRGDCHPEDGVLVGEQVAEDRKVGSDRSAREFAGWASAGQEGFVGLYAGTANPLEANRRATQLLART